MLFFVGVPSAISGSNMPGSAIAAKKQNIALFSDIISIGGRRFADF